MDRCICIVYVNCTRTIDRRCRDTIRVCVFVSTLLKTNLDKIMSNISLDLHTPNAVIYNQQVEIFNFPGGEVSITLPEEVLGHTDIPYIIVNAQITNSDNILALLLVKDAIDNAFPGCDVDLSLGYIPYARQDRVCNKGEAFSSKVFANLINNMHFRMIRVVDPHSDVSVSLFNTTLRIIKQEELLSCIPALSIRLNKGVLTLVSPDAGAIKKTQGVSKAFGGIEVIQATKERDLATGKLSGFNYYGDVNGKDLLIVDDICDGGGTFIGLASKLKEGGAKSVSLFVSHGIFSKGVDVLINSGIDCVYTTDTFPSGCKHEYLFILKQV